MRKTAQVTIFIGTLTLYASWIWAFIIWDIIPVAMSSVIIPFILVSLRYLDRDEEPPQYSAKDWEHLYK